MANFWNFLTRSEIISSEPEVLKLKEKLRCEHCRGWHLRYCGRLKRIIFKTNSSEPYEIEYWPDDQWDMSNTYFEDDDRYIIEVE